jgi:hypothetical protein
MKHTSKQWGRSRNKALAQRAAQLGCGISLLAVSAMLAARPARAGGADPASVVLNGFPSESSSAGFVTSDSQQLNSGVPVSAVVNDETTSSTVDNTATGSLPSTASVTGNELAALATGSSQTNTVDFANIGTSDAITGISSLAEQLNTFSTEGDIFTAGTFNSTVENSTLTDQTTNAVSGDTLDNSSNLIEAQTTGNTATSSVNGVVPVNYGSSQAGTLSLSDFVETSLSGTASGNVVVASSQLNAAIDGGNGSAADVYENSINLDVNSTGEAEDPQSVSLATTESGNAISSIFAGNAANNDIGVSLTSGASTGAPSFAGALVVGNEQSNNDLSYEGPTGDFGAYTGAAINTSIAGTFTPTITLNDGSVAQNNNIISATATGNSAVGAAGAPGNEISLGINLAGTTPLASAGNTITTLGTLNAGGDLVLGNEQYQGGTAPSAVTRFSNIDAYVQNLAGSSIGQTNNALTSSAFDNNAANAIETASGAGINLISGLAALSSGQVAVSGAYASVGYGGIDASAGYDGGGLNLTNSTATLSDNKISSTAVGNQAANNIALAASTIDAGASGAASGPAVLSGGLTIESPSAIVADAGISLNNLQRSGGFSEVEADQYSVGVGAYVQGDTLSNDSVIIANPVFTAEATANSATNAIMADGSQGVSGSIGLLNTQEQDGGAAGFLLEGDEGGPGNDAIIALQSLGEDQGISGSSALLTGSEFYAEATDNSASNTLDATGGTLSNIGAAYGTLGLAAQLGGLDQVASQAVSDLALANNQDDIILPAYADNIGSINLIDVDSSFATVSSSSFTVSGPASGPEMQALAIGNEAINALSALADTVLTDTAGLVNAQANSIGAEAYLESAYTAVGLNSPIDTESFEESDDGGDISNTSITVGTGAAGGSNANILRALAYANQASNVLSVSAGTVNPDATAASFAVDGSVISNEAPFDTGLTGDYGVGAAYALLSDQSANGTITASVDNDNIDGFTELGIYIGNTTTNPSLTDVTANTDGNAVVSSAFGNQASNSATVAANNLAAETYYPVADVTNLQTNQGTVNAMMTLTNDPESPLLTTQLIGDGEILDSTLGLTDNTVLTQAEGNNATNSLDTTGGNITDVAPEALGEVKGATFDEATSADQLAFSVQNSQDEESPITVNQTGANALVATGGAVAYSTLTADTNAFEATGYGNNATNSLDFGGTSSPVDLLDTSAGLQNEQYAQGTIGVTLGSPGVAAVPAGLDTYIPDVIYTVQPGNSSADIIDGDILDVSGEPLTFHVGGLTDTQLTDFENLFSDEGVYDADTETYTLPVGEDAYSDPDLFSIEGGYLYVEVGSAETGQSTNTDEIPGTPAVAAVPPSPDVLITVAGSIASSTLDVSGNAFDATAVANNAVNTQNIAATAVNGGADVSGDRGGEVDGYYSYGNADYVLANDQSTESSISATANGEAGINPTNTSTITSSSLIVSGNTQLAEAEGEIASNTLTLSATDTAGGEGIDPPSLALVSNQSGDGDVTATAGTFGLGIEYGLVVTAPGAITDSTLTMDSNSSEALAVENNVTNLLSADATNLAGISDGFTEYEDYGEGDVYADTQGDYSLTNVQTVYPNTVSASDVTNVTNSDSTSVSSTGLVDSTASISGNTTSAFAEANAASNTLDMTSANSTATGVLTNAQDSRATVNAYGGAFDVFGLNGSEDPNAAAAAGSAINVTNNSTVVQGIGNQATNALNADTGDTYGVQDNASTDATEAAATYTVLNSQNNVGAVSAEGGSVYATALNGGGAVTPVANTTVTVSYNTVDVKAFGNSAINTATVSALNAGNATVALANVQTNTGAITATGDGSQIGSTIGGPGASNTTVEVGNNSVIASAIGNVATNTIVH